ncbi:hypothetical protein K2173_024720 [Erythroxylum novogranatense]|uniref:Neprosin PEP catalytic domain-containing protein n=1 Tax=Erythroxylum novogranatense TaxID=1862640 RepID=A0AAV8SVX6_9ROSI|nr:hypothetical protein K2173_024720 [Erythroxylum novogranatense]
MAPQCHRKNIGSCIFFFIAFAQIWSYGLGDGSRISAKKTIKNDGDAIDCVEIYKQPAFTHPLLKNHTIQMKPSSFPSGNGVQATNSSKIFQSWFNKIKCPEGTVPILRTRAFTHRPVSPPIPKRADISEFTPSATYEYAQVSLTGGTYYGACATFNVWVPKVVDPGEVSTAQMWIVSGDGENLNSIEVGWQVQSGSNVTRFFSFWTRDAYRSTGCYNLECPGFIQVNPEYVLGFSLQPTSIYGGDQYEMTVIIHKDNSSGNWWLTFQGQDLGYWPGDLFTSLADSANLITFGGGQVINNQYGGHHTTTEMGSGHYPIEGFGKAAYIGHLQYVDASNVLRIAYPLLPFITKTPCYYITMLKDEVSTEGVHLYFGGPGYSDQCP